MEGRIMNTTSQTVTLKSKDNFGQRVPPKAFGELLSVLPDAVRYSVRMAFESRSRARGKRPSWLAAASDIRFVDHSGDDTTILHFEAPYLGEAASKLYEQAELWPTRPDASDTGFDLLADVIADITASNGDSERFDRPLLQEVERFRRGLNGWFQQMEFTGNRYPVSQPAVITSAVIESARRLSHNTPQPQQTRLAGKLDMIRDSTNSFAIKLKDGQEVRGVLIDGEIAKVSALFRQEVLVLGKAIYRPSGKLLRIDADEVVLAGVRDQFFSAIPKPKRSRYDLREVLREQQHKKGLPAIFGKWPGDESDEQIAEAMKELGL
jgi:hypothetical protein